MKNHHHKCPRRERIWSHGEDCKGSHRAHRCPDCKTSQYMKHDLTREEKAQFAERKDQP